MKTCREGSILGSYWKILLAAMRMSQRYVLESKILSAQKFRRGKKEEFPEFLMQCDVPAACRDSRSCCCQGSYVCQQA